MISLAGLACQDRPRGEFDDRVREEAHGDPPWGDVGSHLPNLSGAVEIDDVDGKPHKKGVDRLAWNDPEGFARGKVGAPKKAFAAGGGPVGNFDHVCENRFAGEIPNLHF